MLTLKGRAGKGYVMVEENTGFTLPEIPANEQERLNELYSLNLLDSASDQRFDRYTHLVADLFDFPIVLVTLVDQEKQWFKSSCGLDLRETSRDISFCAHAINAHGVMVVPDAKEDPRFSGNPLVTGPPFIRFYAGAVVHGPHGQALGTLCVIDRRPRVFGNLQSRRLRQFADLLESEIAHRHDLNSLRASVLFSAYYDPLTGIANRRLLEDRLGRLIELADREQRSVGVLLFNISGLRLINQSFGSDTGDDLLCQVAERLNSCCPPGGTLARLQADEFILSFSPPRGSDREIDRQAYLAAESLGQPFLSGGREHYIQVQIGGSVFPEHGGSVAALIERASAAIRFTSGGPVPGVHFFSAKESLDISERLRIESLLRAALARKHLHLVYQPIVDLRTGRVAAVEALCRWQDPELGEISPARFIPIAEQSGLATSMGQWVQETACAQIKHWQEECGCQVSVAINLAAPELQQPDFAQNLLALLAEQSIDTGLLWLEVTEHSLVGESQTLEENLLRFQQAGVHISIDDFGTGYSSLSYINRFPISSLKIDQAFTGGLPDGRNELALTRAVISMAEALDIGTVGEGVETRAQLDCLVRHGCDFAQGFYIARPASPEQVPDLCQRALVDTRVGLQ